MRTPGRGPDYGPESGVAAGFVHPTERGHDVPSRSTRAHMRGTKTVRDLALWPLWVNPEHRVGTSLVIMKGHGVKALGVLSNNEFHGLLNMEDLLGIPGEALVERHVTKDVLTATLDDPLSRVADMMARERVDRVVVLCDGRFHGIVFAEDLLGDVARNVDAVTGLPWSDALREWGVARLAEGRELCILFFDLDDFGEYNKRFGHLVGDRVLKHVAEELILATDPQRDLVCRYGGDEFVVATLRLRAEAEVFARAIVERIRGAVVEGGPKPISITVGVFGGRRTRERENVHLASTLDNLINRASQECMAAKRRHAPNGDLHASDKQVDESELPVDAIDGGGATANGNGGNGLKNGSHQNGFRLESVTVSPAEGRFTATAIIGQAERSATGQCYRAGTVAEAAVKAVHDAVSKLRGVYATPEFEDVLVGERDGKPRFVTVVAGWSGGSGASTRLVETDEAHAAASAALEAIAQALAQEPEDE